MIDTLESQLRFVFERLGYHPTRRILKAHFGHHFSRGKDELIEQVIQLAASNVHHQEFINQCGANCVQLGTRQVELFSIKDNLNKKALNNFIDNVELSKHPRLANAYPFPITDQKELSLLKKNHLEIMETGTVDLGESEYKFVVFSTVVEHEVKIDGSAFLNQAGVDLVTTLNAQFYYVTNAYRQLFHALYWSEQDESAILSVDKNGISVHQSRDQLFLIKNHIEQKAIGALGNPMNVFDAIAPLYNSADGRIIRLGHVTSDGNPVRLSLSRGQHCLKLDKYHEAGEDGGHVHAKFAVGKRWSFGTPDERFTVEVDLAGKAAMLDTAQPLSDFEVAKCTRLLDLNFAIQNVRPHSCY